jgi:hypothetical protein
MNARNRTRIMRYRRLALGQADRRLARLLNKLADEAERGVLCTVDRLHQDALEAPSPPVKTAQPPTEHTTGGPPPGWFPLSTL